MRSLIERRWTGSLVLAALACAAAWPAAQQRTTGAVALDPDDIGGIVESANGPEAGVWVIAEATGLKTRYIKSVTTDERGRYVLPDLPRGQYQVFVRGYGLVDSPRVAAEPGQSLNLTAAIAPSPRAAADYYPPKYWFALMDGADLDLKVVKDGCMNCHQMGNRATREISPSLGTFKTSLDAWDRRVRSGSSGGQMSAAFMLLGPARKAFAEWSDRIAAGAFPTDVPPRPTGIERNIVVTQWDWGEANSFSHTHSVSYRKSPSVNANGRIYGPDGTNDNLLWLDPNEHVSGRIKLPSREPLENRNAVLEPSPYWGTERTRGASNPRSGVMDHLGRPYMTARIRGNTQPAFCKAGSANKFAQYFPIERGGSGVARYDPKTETWATIDTCWSADHNEFGGPPDYSLFFGASNAVAWINTRTFDRTGDEEAAQGWCPAVLDTNGDGRISTGWTEPDQSVDPTKDHRITFGCYYAGWNPADRSIWCAGAQNAGMIPENRRTPSLMRMDLGSNPPQSCRAERFEAPPQAGIAPAGERGVAIDSQGVVWLAYRQSDHVSSFDRRKCKGPLNGPTATGQHCPEGWSFYRREDQPTFRNTRLHADDFYSLDLDQFNWSGLGKDTKLLGAANSDAAQALLPNGQFIDIHIPYPMGFFTRNIQGRIDAPKAGWKGKAAWTAGMSYTVWHQEGGKGQKPTVIKIQARPDPLAK